MIKILLAKPHGFCAGVAMAIDVLEDTLLHLGPPLYSYHEVVHNRFLVDDFRRRGIIFVNHISEIPPKATVVFSAHGVSPEVWLQCRKLQLRVIDTTCPLVKKVHRETRRFVASGYTVILIGHAGHDEVEGVVGEASDSIIVIETIDDAESLELPAGTKVAYLTQTTLGVDDTKRIVDVLKRRFPGIQGPNTEDICYATQNRQQAVRFLSDAAEMLVVIGSQNSSNSRRLVEVGEACGLPSYLIDGPDDLQMTWFEGRRSVLLTAGASVPEQLVLYVIARLRQHIPCSVEEHVIREELISFPQPSLVSFAG